MFFHVVCWNHCNVLICTTNQIIVPWTVINVEASINFEKLLVQIKSGTFSTISALLELSSSILDSGYTNLLIIQQFIERITLYEI